MYVQYMYVCMYYIFSMHVPKIHYLQHVSATMIINFSVCIYMYMYRCGWLAEELAPAIEHIHDCYEKGQ